MMLSQTCTLYGRNNKECTLLTATLDLQSPLASNSPVNRTLLDTTEALLKANAIYQFTTCVVKS